MLNEAISERTFKIRRKKNVKKGMETSGKNEIWKKEEGNILAFKIPHLKFSSFFYTFSPIHYYLKKQISTKNLLTNEIDQKTGSTNIFILSVGTAKIQKYLL